MNYEYFVLSLYLIFPTTISNGAKGINCRYFCISFFLQVPVYVYKFYDVASVYDDLRVQIEIM